MSRYDTSPQRLLTPVTQHLIIINCLMLAAAYVLRRVGIDLDDWLALHYYDADNYLPTQMVTYMFMHAGLDHLFFNMLSLFFFGPVIERVWGSQRMLVYYLACGVGAAISQLLAWRFGVVATVLHEAQLTDPAFTYGQLVEEGMGLLRQLSTVGASGAVFGILLAYGMTFPDSYVYFYFVIPIKAKYFVIGYGILELMAGVSATGDGVAHFAHLGGMLVGLVLILLWRRSGPARGRFSEW